MAEVTQLAEAIEAAKALIARVDKDIEEEGYGDTAVSGADSRKIARALLALTSAPAPEREYRWKNDSGESVAMTLKQMEWMVERFVSWGIKREIYRIQSRTKAGLWEDEDVVTPEAKESR